MPKTKLILALSALLATAAPLTAQVGSLSDGTLGQTPPQNAAPAPADDVTVEQIGAWELQCAKDGPEPRPCRMYQLLADAQGNAVAEVTMYRLPEGGQAAAGATFIAPLESLLTVPLTITIGEQVANRVPYAYCNSIGCLARMGLSAIEAEYYKNADQALVSIIPARAPDQVVTVIMSLDGFKEAYEKATPVPQ